MALVSILPLLFLLLTSCHYAAAQTVALLRTGQSCPEEMVTYTCSVGQGIALNWIFEPFILDSDPIRFQQSTPIGTSVDCRSVSRPQCDNITFVATLTSVSNRMGQLADINSTLTIYAPTRQNGKVVQCRGVTAAGNVNITHDILNFSAPSPPRTPSSTVQEYGRDSVTLTVQWQPPQNDGGDPVNYTITVSPGLSPVTTSGTSVPVTMSYNVIHTVSIVSTNCIGNSSAAMMTIRIANCGDPTVPRNGSIEAYQNTTEGAEIFFRCNPEYVPTERMTAVCGADGRWNPDPADHRCSSTGTQVLLPLWALVLAAIGTLALTI